MLWLVTIWQVSSCRKCSILKLVYFDSWSWQSFVSTCDVFNCLFLLDVRNAIQLLSRVSWYSWLVCLLGFWLRNTWRVKVGNSFSDGVDSFCFSPCLIEKSEAILAILDSFQELHLEWSAWVIIAFVFVFLIYLISWSRAQFMRLSLSTFELRFEIMIWPIVWGLI